jgi:hypothetical protein
MDADGATDLWCLAALERRLYRRGCQIAVGSRAAAVANRPAGRRLMGFVFSALAGALVPGVPDTQCGFKLLSRRAARRLMPRLRIYGWAYDVDLLSMAIGDGMRVVSVPVRWRDVAGSKIRPLTPLAMLADLARLFVERVLGQRIFGERVGGERISREQVHWERPFEEGLFGQWLLGERLFGEGRAVATADECGDTKADITRPAAGAGFPPGTAAASAFDSGHVCYFEVHVGADSNVQAVD